MSQNTIHPADGTGAVYEANNNAANDTLASHFSGGTAPSSTTDNQFWADTTAGLLKMRNTANSAWVVIGTLNAIALGLLSLAGGNMAGAFNENMVGITVATSMDIGGAAANVIYASGAGTVNTFPVAGYQAGARRKIICASVFTIHGGATIGNACVTDIVTGVGDWYEYVLSAGSAQWQLTSCSRTDGQQLGVVNVAHGGTGNTSYSTYNVMCSGATPTSPLGAISGGLVNQFLRCFPGGYPGWDYVPGTYTAGTPATQNPINPGTAFNAAHGLAAVPDKFKARLVCLTTDLGWAVGDEVDVTSNMENAGANPSLVIGASTSTVYVQTSAGPLILNRGTSTISAITASKWKLVVTPYKLN